MGAVYGNRMDMKTNTKIFFSFYFLYSTHSLLHSSLTCFFIISSLLFFFPYPVSFHPYSHSSPHLFRFLFFHPHPFLLISYSPISLLLSSLQPQHLLSYYPASNLPYSSFSSASVSSLHLLRSLPVTGQRPDG